MRFFTIVLVAASTLLAAASLIQPDSAAIQAAAAKPAPPTRRSGHHERMTNAARLRRGLPPLPPRHIPRTGTPTHQVVARASSSPSPSPSPSAGPGGPPAPPSVTAVIKITSKTDGTVLGYVSKDFALFGEFAIVQEVDAALAVGIPRLRAGLNGPVTLQSLNGPEAPYNYLSAVTGFASSDDNLAPGLPNYKYLAAADLTPAFSGPVKDVANAFTHETGIAVTSESSIWYVNTFTQEITATWINPDGKPALKTQPVLYKEDGVIIFTGDVDAFVEAFGDGIPVKFTLVDIST